MDILIANKFFHLKGGAEQNVFDERRALIEGGHDVLDFAMKDERNEKSEYIRYFTENISYDNILKSIWKLKNGVNPVYSWNAKHQMEKLLRENNVDVAHLHNIYHQLTTSILEPLKNTKTFLTLHDYKLICPNYILYNKGLCTKCKDGKIHCITDKCVKNSFVKSAIAYLESKVAKYSSIDSFISPSNFLKETFEDFGFRGEITHIPNGLDLKRYTPSKVDGDYILYMGRKSPEKGVQDLVDACNWAKIKLKIAGSGATIPGAEHLGHLNFNELGEAVRNSRFVAVPSKWWENQPYAVLQSYGWGKPVLTPYHGGFKEIVEDDVTGKTYYEGGLRDCLKSFYDDAPNLRKTARGFAEKNHDINDSVKSLLKLFNS